MSISCSDAAPACSAGVLLRTALAAAILVALTATTVSRNVRWHTLLSMWEDCAQKSPNKSRTHNNLGNCHLLLGRHIPALLEYQKAVVLDPGNFEAQYNLARTADTLGMYNLALRPYEVFCRFAQPIYAKQKATACARFAELKALAGAGPGAAK